MQAYHCNCGSCSKAHIHVVRSVDVAQRRGAFRERIVTSETGGLDSRSCTAPTLLATSFEDAVSGAILGLMIGDALAAPLHWIYTWPAAASFKESFFGGKLRHYTATPPAAQAGHPDSHKYFSRCTPASEPFPAIFGAAASAASAWRTPGTPYHGSLPAGDNTLTARLVAVTSRGIAAQRGFDADVYAADYVRVLLEGRASGANNDTWVDESHRVFFRNIARGAAPAEAGLDDCCLTGLALSVPCNLAYLGNRDAADLACRSQLQLTHKSEDMLGQVAMLGDLLRHLASALALASQVQGQQVAPAADSDASPSGSKQEQQKQKQKPEAQARQVQADLAGAVDALASLRAFARAFSNGKVELGQLQERLDRHLLQAPNLDGTPAGEAAAAAAAAEDGGDEDALWRGDEVAFHGDGPTGEAPVFSLR